MSHRDEDMDRETPQKPDADGAELDSVSQLEQRARELLRESAEQLDGNTRSRLARARAAAIEAAHGERRNPIGLWLPVGTLAAAAAMAFLTWSARERVPEPQLADAPVGDRTVQPYTSSGVEPLDDLEILGAHESFELLEDLEFYAAIDLDDGADIG